MSHWRRAIDWLRSDWLTSWGVEPDSNDSALDLARDFTFTDDIDRLLCRAGRADLVPDRTLRSDETTRRLAVLLKSAYDRIDEINEHIDETEYKARMARDADFGE